MESFKNLVPQVSVAGPVSAPDQGGFYALGKAHMRSTMSVRGSTSVPVKQIKRTPHPTPTPAMDRTSHFSSAGIHVLSSFWFGFVCFSNLVLPRARGVRACVRACVRARVCVCVSE